MSWKMARLAAHCEVFSGHPFQSASFSDDPADVALIKGENIGQGEILWNISKRWPRTSLDGLDRFKLRPGDVVLAMDRPWVPAGLKFARISDRDPDALLVQRVARLRAFDSLDQSLLPYLIGSSTFVNYIKNIARGVGVPHISGRQIGDYEFVLPPIETQRRVASVLGAYDDLIENNRRRMVLLGEAARQLYQEWFVRLRFPGHEDVRIVDGVPDGWVQSDLEAACVPENGIQTGPFGSQLHQSDYSDDGAPVVMPKDILGARVIEDSIARVPDEIRQRLCRHVLKSGDIVLARRGDIGRKAFVTKREDGWLCGTGCMRLRPNAEIVAPRVLFETIGRADVMGIIVGRAQGSIMPNLNLDILANVPIIIPPLALQRAFLDFAEPIDRQIGILAAQSEQLKHARDLLLPRLMSGEIEV